jgi:hypothetical protein
MTSTPATMPFPFGSPPVHRITVDEYERIIRAGALEDPGKVELIDGYLLDKSGTEAPGDDRGALRPLGRLGEAVEGAPFPSGRNGEEELT